MHTKDLIYLAFIAHLAQLQHEVGKLRKQLQSVRSKLLQSEQREAEAHLRIQSLQQDLAAHRADMQETGGKVCEMSLKFKHNTRR